ncbi:hypothetical protein RhiirA5_436412 [Rhizophagus irregularis]|uniref:Uncharacterized protein n=1 Tax=Rhizophagus irregularis TaxID=588596 RepID=A0A2I1FJ73_9GLOM|nr:hypothetical protein RhiirA5_436412 [Rhizophagus irregularis]PKY34430.1 hypothetical protein RhiirB3_454128 [Rhizophagus irregularis]
MDCPKCITHVIKRYVRVGCNLVDGTNIKMAFQDLSGTSIAHIEPNQDQFNIRANSIASFCGASYRPPPTISDPTIPKSSWMMPIPDEKKGSIRIIVLIKNNYNREKNAKYWTRNPITNNNESDIGEFPFDAGWALKENLQLGNKAGWRKAYIKKDGSIFAKLFFEDELVSKEIPTIKTIKGWIRRYSKSFKKKASEHALTETNGIINNSNSND